MTLEWGIIFLSFIAACAYFSYINGFKSGANYGMETVLNNLHEKGLIELEEDPSEN